MISIKCVTLEIPCEPLRFCPDCGCQHPELHRLTLADGHDAWKVMCPVCGHQTLLCGTGEVSSGDESAVRDWNTGGDPKTVWCCRHCKAWNVGRYYKFCPYCGEERK